MIHDVSASNGNNVDGLVITIGENGLTSREVRISSSGDVTSQAVAEKRSSRRVISFSGL